MAVNLYLVHALDSDGNVLDDEGLNHVYAVADYASPEAALAAAEDHLAWLAPHSPGEILAVGS